MSAEKLDAEAPMMRRERFLALRVVIRVRGVLLGEKVGVVVTGRNRPYFAEERQVGDGTCSSDFGDIIAMMMLLSGLQEIC